MGGLWRLKSTVRMSVTETVHDSADDRPGFGGTESRGTDNRGDTSAAATPAAGQRNVLGSWIRYQALAALVVAGAAFGVDGRVASYSSLFGSLAALVPTLVFAAVLGRRIGSDSSAFLGAAVLAELLKWLVCGAICIAVFVGVEPLAAGWFFTGMVLVILSGWLGLFFSS